MTSYLAPQLWLAERRLSQSQPCFHELHRHRQNLGSSWNKNDKKTLHLLNILIDYLKLSTPGCHTLSCSVLNNKHTCSGKHLKSLISNRFVYRHFGWVRRWKHAAGSVWVPVSSDRAFCLLSPTCPERSTTKAPKARLEIRYRLQVAVFFFAGVSDGLQFEALRFLCWLAPGDTSCEDIAAFDPPP